MTLVDRFVCRREGHLPQLTITKANDVSGPIITKCQRCGKFIEIETESRPEGRPS